MSSEESDILKNNSESNFESLMEASSKLKVPSSKFGKEDAWNMIMQSIDQGGAEKTKVVSFSPSTIWISVAAALLLLFTITTLTYIYSSIDAISPKGSLTNLILPDSSEVILNADSRIEYRKYGWLSNREIKLYGEAYFTVKHGNRFTVLTDFNRKIVVLGTKFNIFSRGIQLEVKCFEGSVSVETPKAQPIALAKGKGVHFSKFEELPQPLDLDSLSTPKWIEGEFYFKNIALKEVFDELSRQFNASINYSADVSPETRNYTGFFKHSNLTQALDLICLPMGLSYQISSDSTSIRVSKQ